MATGLKILSRLFFIIITFSVKKIYQLTIQGNRLRSNRHLIKQAFGEKVFFQSGSAKRVRSKGFHQLVILGNGIR